MPILLSLASSKWLWIGVVIAVLTGTTTYYKHRYESEQVAFIKYQAAVVAVGKAAQDAADTKAKEYQDNIAKQEKHNVESQKAITAKYERFIRGLRESNDSPNQMPSASIATSIVGGCTDQDGFSRDLAGFEEAVAREILQPAEAQATQLKAVLDAWP